ncbi:MAG: hypothetical protein JWP89_1238 [Schlesneria sp.]|nr:hypothetical protein [Schlesneria sp.]
MFFNGVRLPDELRIALEEERLVIFAGAGVSMPEPSNLPSFNDLASKIAGGERVDPGREDRFLGKLERERKTDVHAAASRLLHGEHTRPTLLHTEMLRLFSDASKVRLVTTNFDPHFSVAAQKLFRKSGLREYCAPALPLGDDFNGLIYLHGSASLTPGQLVLTDKDFGAAYLTRGWARDFLVSLFSHYTVLFVGYSHDDVTTTYLARGLEPSEIVQRWAMVPSDATVSARENWQHLDISVVEYPINPINEKNPHQALTDFFSHWADHSKESVFGRARRVRAIARGLPSESESESSYLHYCLSNPQLADEFCKAIQSAAWVAWLHDRGYFNTFFSDTVLDAPRVKSQHVLAHWLCSYVRQYFPDLLLNMIRNHRQLLTREFSGTLAHCLWSEERMKADPMFAVWVSVLLSQGKQAVSGDIWAYLLGTCSLPKHSGVALSLFELLTTPTIQLKTSLDWSPLTADADGATRQRKIDYSIEWPQESQHWLREAWTKVFEPHLTEISDSLSRIIVKQLTHAYLLLRGVGKNYQRFDELSRIRRSIAPHEQDDVSVNKCFSCIVDILRCILDHWIQTEPSWARQQVEAWWSTKFPLLMRFAAYARSSDALYPPDESVQWVLENNLVFRSSMKKEVFDILASAYPKASSRIRRFLLRRIDRGYRGTRAKSSDEEMLAYEKFNVLIWLRRSDSDCPLVQSAIAKIQTVYPHFGERDHPEFDAWVGKAGFVDPTEGFDFASILTASPGIFAEDLIQARDGALHRGLRGHVQCLPKLFKQDKEWAKRFVEALLQKSGVDQEIWNGVLWGWRDVIETSDDWRWILSTVEKLPHEPAIYAGIANLISHEFRKDHSSWDENISERAASLMDDSWEHCKSEKESADESYGDWLTTAINHVGGWIGEFWVHYCSHLRQLAGDNWQGIPASLKTKVKEALNGSNRTKVCARIALTPWIGFLFAWDREFAVEYMLPLLDWKRDPIVAQQSWSVLLNYKAGTSKELELQLIPFYRQCVEQVTEMLKDASEKSGQFDQTSLQHLGYQLAALAVHVIADPVDSGFFHDFLPLLPNEVRGAMANGIGEQLEELDDAERWRLWDTWLRRYLDQRLIGIPTALSTTETKYMMSWCLNLGQAFSEAVERIEQMPHEAVFAFSIVSKLASSLLVDEAPLAACRLANSALLAEDFPHLHSPLITLHEKFKSTIRRHPEFSKYEELLYQRGWKKP